MRSSVRLVVLGNGAPGAEKQAMALSQRLCKKIADDQRAKRSNVICLSIEYVRVSLKRAFWLPPQLQVYGANLLRNPFFGYNDFDMNQLVPKAHESSALNVFIGCGRSTVALCALLKQRQPTRTFNVQIQHPRVSLAWFDTVIAPRHDFTTTTRRADNLLLTSGTIHDITPEVLLQHDSTWKDNLNDKLQGRQKRVVWLVGGPCRGFAFTKQETKQMVDDFSQALPHEDELAVLVTFSRRTPRHVQTILQHELNARFANPGQLLIFQGTEVQNPYVALLATASFIVTTPDSVAMTTEAVASGKPVFTIGLNLCKGKFRRFHQHLLSMKATAPLTALRATTTLQCHSIQKHSSASTVLESELSAITDSIVKRIYQALPTTN